MKPSFAKKFGIMNYGEYCLEQFFFNFRKKVSESSLKITTNQNPRNQ